MIYSVYAVRDLSLGYGAPIIQENDAVAMRSFANACNDKSSLWYTHCADFYLDCIGHYDTDTGELIPINPERVCAASDIVSSLKDGDLHD